MSELCTRCRRALRKEPYSQHARRYDAGNEVLRALGTGPRTLRQLAIGVYGEDSADNRCKVSRLLCAHRDVVEPLGDRKTWRLVGIAEHVEAAE